MRKIFKSFGVAAAFLGLALVACVGTLAIYFSNLPAALRPIAGGGFALVAMSLILAGSGGENAGAGAPSWARSQWSSLPGGC